VVYSTRLESVRPKGLGGSNPPSSAPILLRYYEVMKITEQDFRDSLNPFHPIKQIKAKMKIAPVVILIAVVISFVLAVISLITGHQFF
jgi:hypothetical protein